MNTMIEFFCEKLGFAIDTKIGPGPSFAMLKRDDQTVMMQCRARYLFRPKGWAIYFWIDDLDQLIEEFSSRGAAISVGPTEKPYGCREIEVRAPDGRDIVFGQRMS